MDDQIHFFETNYRIIADYHIFHSSKKIFIGNKHNRICRYCKKRIPDVTFKKIAHAIPEFIGNKRLFAYDECDICNDFFSTHLEDHFGKLLGVTRTINKIKGKKGVPSYKSVQGKSRIDMTEHGLHITEKEGDEIVGVDDKSRRITINAHLQPYIPLAVFRCLVKIGLSIMPNDELINFKETIHWILKEDYAKEPFQNYPFFAFETFIPGNHPHKGIKAFLLRRISDDKLVPYMFLVLAFGNFFYQIFIPTLRKEYKLIGNKIDISYFSTPFDQNNKYGNCSGQENTDTELSNI